jgi:hypothetical protein
MNTLYNLSKNECVTLTNLYNTGELAFILWNRGNAKSLESGIKKAIKIKNFAQKTEKQK